MKPQQGIFGCAKSLINIYSKPDEQSGIIGSISEKSGWVITYPNPKLKEWAMICTSYGVEGYCKLDSLEIAGGLNEQ